MIGKYWKGKSWGKKKKLILIMRHLLLLLMKCHFLRMLKNPPQIGQLLSKHCQILFAKQLEILKKK
uniref:Uncharacterized protein n=1 Tax=Meloidogyne enterolobii TaxID=390850 RepID=A0A6V7U3A5_MELEN|nr:unnamed protein product [Meloidogyne enterolobii]